MSIALFIIGAVYGNSIDWAEIEEVNPRMVRIFTDYEDDGSIRGRKERSDAGWNDIVNNPIIGRFGGQREVEGWAAYMHDVFSYWRQFGFLAFGTISLLYLLFFFFCVVRYPTRNSFYYAAPFLLGTFLVVESALSRSFAFGYTHLFFGLLLAFHAWSRLGDAFLSPYGRRTRRSRRRRRKAVRSTIGDGYMGG